MTKITRSSVGLGLPHDSSISHVTGSAVYVDDLPELPGTLYIAAVLSPCSRGRLRNIDCSVALSLPGVIDILTSNDIPGRNDIAPILSDEPVFASKSVEHHGQIVAAVIAERFDIASRAASLVRLDIVESRPCLDVRDAYRRGRRTVDDQHLIRGNPNKFLGGSNSPGIFEGRVESGGQDHFYLEGQVAYAVPTEGGMTLHSSTQHPSEVQLHVSHVLGCPAHDIDVQVRRLGGGFGGKESQATIIAAIAALGCDKTGRPCRFRLRRCDDMLATGKRHGFVTDWRVSVTKTGRIRALSVESLANSGHVADLSGPVVTRALTHIDNCYYIPHADFLGVSCKTDTVSNTAFRGFGGPQGMLVMETIIDTVSRQLGIDPNEMRARNYYGVTGNTTPYGQRVTDNRISAVVDRVLSVSDYARRRREIDSFNSGDGHLKRGIAMMPVKFGISFNLPTLNQAGALVHVYRDGSVHLNHGGTEMGQGLFVKVAQVVAETFGLDVSCVKITPTTTQKVPNTSATAASSGSDLNGAAARSAALTIRGRMEGIAATHFGCHPKKLEFRSGRVFCGNRFLGFGELAERCWFERVSLSSTGYYRTPKIHWDGERLRGRPYYYYTYGAAVSEVIIDTLTGENRCLRADIVQDCGYPLNPLVDLGQIEGAFVQGMGWLTCEELYWDSSGHLRTIGPSTYKIPGSRDVPPEFNVEIMDDRPNVENTVFGSKAIGEPPLMLSISVFLALRDAVSSLSSGLSSGTLASNLDAPATPERILFSVEDMKRRVSAGMLP